MYCPDFAIFGFKNDGEKKEAPKVAVPAPSPEEAQDAR
jgi:hypothetical protein